MSANDHMAILIHQRALQQQQQRGPSWSRGRDCCHGGHRIDQQDKCHADVRTLLIEIAT
jgi:hypothetical protein